MKKYSLIYLTVVFFLSAFISARNQHATYDALLKKYVSNDGSVDYLNLKKEHQKLKGYIKNLESSPVSTSANRQDQLAYWINLYNALTLNLILDNYPVESIMKIDKAWDIDIVSINGEKLTLNDIEHKIIRPKFKDARIHFAVNCAAKSCPKLLNEAYTGDKLDDQLNSQTKWFINNKSYNKLSTSSVKLSKIFEWYREDFGDLIAFLNMYGAVKVSKDASVAFVEYNWELNSK